MQIEDVCSEFQEAFPKEQLALVGERELLCLFCLGAYVLLLARCCRGWGARDDRPGREKLSPVEDRASKRRTSYFREDPLKQYKSNPGLVLRCDPAVSESFPRRFKRTAAGGKLDLGSFLIGVEISLRHSHPLKTMGLFGPLTNGGFFELCVFYHVCAWCWLCVMGTDVCGCDGC